MLLQLKHSSKSKQIQEKIMPNMCMYILVETRAIGHKKNCKGSICGCFSQKLTTPKEAVLKPC